MSKKLHSFDLKGLHWSSLGRPRNACHGHNEAATSVDSSTFVFKAERNSEISPSKLAESLRDLRIPRGKAVHDHHRLLTKGKQLKNDDLPHAGEDVVRGARLLTSRRELKNEEESDDAVLTKFSGTAVQNEGSVNCEGGRRWNLRNRRQNVLSKGAGSSTRSTGSSNKGKEKDTSDCNDGKMEMPSLPKFSISVTKEEALEDLAKMLGKPPPKKVKKRTRKVQRNIDLLFPGATLESITLERYNVQEKPPARKGK